MFGEDKSTIFLYVLIAAAIIMAAVWYFLITPMERRNHERKLENLQQKIKNHREHIENGSDSPGSTDAEDNE